MPDEVVYVKLRIKQTAVPEADTELADREQVFKITEIDCDPPPSAITEFVKPTELPVIVLERFLQQEERDRLGSIGRTGDPAAFANSDTIGVLLGRLGLAKLDIGFFARASDYLNLRKVAGCFRTTIYLRARYQVVEIRVTADEAISVGGTAFPKGDEIATFRVAIPKQIRIEAKYRWNPECCPVRPDKQPEDFFGAWLPRELDWKIGADWKFEKDYWPRLDGEYRLKRDW